MILSKTQVCDIMPMRYDAVGRPNGYTLQNGKDLRDTAYQAILNRDKQTARAEKAEARWETLKDRVNTFDDNHDWSKGRIRILMAEIEEAP